MKSVKKQMIKNPLGLLSTIKIPEISPGNTINGLPLGAYVTNVYDFWRKGIDGTGIIVGIIDNGVNASHPSLLRCPDRSKKIIAEYNFVSGGRTPNTKKEHGTAVAGLITGWTSDGYRGMAPNSRIYSFNVFDTNGEADVNDVVNAVHKAIELGCHIINLSIGSPESNTRLSNVIKRAYNFDIPCICSAGSEGPNTVNYPAAYPESISVGSVLYNYTLGTITKSSFSSTNDQIDCCAVGENILVLDATTNGYTLASGTSFSTAITTGFMALSRQYIINKQINVKTLLTVEVMKNLLYANTLDLFSLGKDNSSGVGFIFRRGITNSPIIIKTHGSN